MSPTSRAEIDGTANCAVHTIRRTQDEELLVVMDKDILRLIWNKIKSVQDSNGEK
ncbi:hypothetical protein WN943_018339 [Citrus x changshan-huyou]